MTHRLPTAVLLTLLAACQGSDDPAALADLTRDGVAALNAGEPGPAYAKLHRAARGLPVDHPRSLEARVGLCRALAHRDAGLSADSFAELSAERDDLEVEDVVAVARELVGVDAFGEATDVLMVGHGRFPDSERLALLVEETGDTAKRAGDHEAVARMKTIGYAGDE